jgi:hypothetical protein
MGYMVHACAMYIKGHYQVVVIVNINRILSSLFYS